jgi:hypothetical protein
MSSLSGAKSAVHTKTGCGRVFFLACCVCARVFASALQDWCLLYDTQLSKRAHFLVYSPVLCHTDRLGDGGGGGVVCDPGAGLLQQGERSFSTRSSVHRTRASALLPQDHFQRVYVACFGAKRRAQSQTSCLLTLALAAPPPLPPPPPLSPTTTTVTTTTTTATTSQLVGHRQEQFAEAQRTQKSADAIRAAAAAEPAPGA